MPLDYDRLMALPPIERVHSYDWRDTILYALGIGADELRFVYEEGLQALPTMAVIAGYPGFFVRDPKYGIDWRRVLHGAQSIELHAPLPPAATVRGITKIEEILDKGAAKGAVMRVRRDIHDVADGRLLAVSRMTTILRGDGGFGGSAGTSSPPHAIPDRPADLSDMRATRTDQALLYRLSGDYNPLHADPEVARAAGFSSPILHGLCTFGVVGLSVLNGLCAGEPGRLCRMDARFSSPVYPGETIRTDIWREGANRAAFRATVVERETVVLNNGCAEYS